MTSPMPTPQDLEEIRELIAVSVETADVFANMWTSPIDHTRAHERLYKATEAFRARIPKGSTVREWLSTFPQSPSPVWQPIDRVKHAWTYGWLWSPPENLCRPEELPGKPHLANGEVRFGQPANYTWATMIIPVPYPVPPAPGKEA